MSVNLLPMVGLGSRFAAAGYKMPKPLIPIDGKPMVLRAIESMPKADKWIFVCRAEHLENHGLGGILQTAVPDCTIISVPGNTAGQLSTCLLAEDKLEADGSLFIAACDAAPRYDHSRYARLIAEKNPDSVAFSFRHDKRVIGREKHYGWLDVGPGGAVKSISVKKPISPNPLDDHCIVGSFYFKTGQLFLDAARALIAADARVNGEFYVDSLVNPMVSAGKKVYAFEVDKFVCWGTPEELEREKTNGGRA